VLSSKSKNLRARKEMQNRRTWRCQNAGFLHKAKRSPGTRMLVKVFKNASDEGDRQFALHPTSTQPFPYCMEMKVKGLNSRSDDSREVLLLS